MKRNVNVLKRSCSRVGLLFNHNHESELRCETIRLRKSALGLYRFTSWQVLGGPEEQHVVYDRWTRQFGRRSFLPGEPVHFKDGVAVVELRAELARQPFARRLDVDALFQPSLHPREQLVDSVNNLLGRRQDRGVARRLTRREQRVRNEHHFVQRPVDRAFAEDSCDVRRTLRVRERARYCSRESNVGLSGRCRERPPELESKEPISSTSHRKLLTG